MTGDDDATPPPLRLYVMVFYYRGSVLDDDVAAQVHAGHLRFLNRQRALGLNLMSGPFDDDGELRGISVYDARDVDEVTRWLRDDPAVAAGALRVEVRGWWSVPGSTLANDAAASARREGLD
jgi:uncharacterized protein YciI